MIGLLGSMLGSSGGRMVGGMVGGRTGAMIGGMLGAVIGGRRLGGALGGIKDKLGGGAGPGPSRLSDGGGDAMEADEAELLVRVMANAAKADGVVDQSEIDAIVGELGDADADEQQFLRQELARPAMSPTDLAATVPEDLRVEAYVVSLAAIVIDEASEVEYLRSFAGAMGIDSGTRTEIHAELGVPPVD